MHLELPPVQGDLQPGVARRSLTGTGPLGVGHLVLGASCGEARQSVKTDINSPLTGPNIMEAILTGAFAARDAYMPVRGQVFDIDQLMLIAAIRAALQPPHAGRSRGDASIR